MKLLLLLSLLAVALADDAYIAEKLTEANDVPQQANAVFQSQFNQLEAGADKRVEKRSYGWSPWSYGHGWPWYGLGGYGGWYTGWPVLHGGYAKIGYPGWIGHGGWYKGW